MSSSYWGKPAFDPWVSYYLSWVISEAVFGEVLSYDYPNSRAAIKRFAPFGMFGMFCWFERLSLFSRISIELNSKCQYKTYNGAKEEKEEVDDETEDDRGDEGGEKRSSIGPINEEKKA